ncbi:MAG: hypothetical protein D3923_07325 [Candidatus Electrothrix sp. AR3]|nr:hypothetical protein [Candidatus Electrothrix sp. AR3]
MNGAFRMAAPGQYLQQYSMYDQGRSAGSGQIMAWFGLSGWIEGALFMGMNAAQSVVNRIK